MRRLSVDSTSDPSTVMKVIKLGHEVEGTKIDSAMNLYQIALQHALKLEYTDGIIYALFFIAGVHRRQSQFDNALKDYQTALSYYHKKSSTEVCPHLEASWHLPMVI